MRLYHSLETQWISSKMILLLPWTAFISAELQSSEINTKWELTLFLFPSTGRASWNEQNRRIKAYLSDMESSPLPTWTVKTCSTSMFHCAQITSLYNLILPLVTCFGKKKKNMLDGEKTWLWAIKIKPQLSACLVVWRQHGFKWTMNSRLTFDR